MQYFCIKISDRDLLPNRYFRVKKIKSKREELVNVNKNKKVRLMFQDEAGFGHINKPKYCWCNNKIIPSVVCQHIRKYRYTYGPVEPKTGENFFLILPNCNTYCMNVFLEELSKAYKEDKILLIGSFN